VAPVSNPYCDRLGIAPPRLLDVVLGPPHKPLDTLVLVLLARGEPMHLEDIVAVLAPLWGWLPEDLRVTLQKAWAGREPVVKDAGGRFTLDTESWRMSVILKRLGLRMPSPPPPRPPEPLLPPPSVRLTVDELEAAFSNGCPWSLPGVRFAAAVLDALDRPMLPSEITALARTWTTGWFPPPKEAPKRKTPGLVVRDSDGRLVLDREIAHDEHYRRLILEWERAEAAKSAAMPRTPRTPTKLAWRGTVVSAQPRIRLTRSFDERSHSYLGYVLGVRGDLGGEPKEFVVAIGKGAQEKHQIRVGDEVSGEGVRVEDPRLETADLYRVSGLKVATRGATARSTAPPFTGVPPSLEEYRARGHRRLAARTYAAKCVGCLWGAEMAVEMIIDPWNPSKRRYRRETFCYGPKSCVLYAAGPARRVPGRRGMSWIEEDWVDEDATAHRAEDA
jgi:hypothetical protein